MKIVVLRELWCAVTELAVENETTGFVDHEERLKAHFATQVSSDRFSTPRGQILEIDSPAICGAGEMPNSWRLDCVVPVSCPDKTVG